MNEDRSARYNRLKRRTSVASLVWTVVLMAGLLVTGATVGLRDAAQALSTAIVPPSLAPSASVFAYVLLLSLLSEVGGLPLGFLGGDGLGRRYRPWKEKGRS